MALEQFKRNLRRIISERGTSPRELTAKTGIDYAQIYIYMNPNKNTSPNATTLERLADALGVTMDELYRGDL